MRRIKNKCLDYCKIMGVEVSSFSEDVRKGMEENMKKALKDKVDGIHHYKMPTKEQWEKANGKRLKTYVPDSTKATGRKDIYGHSEEEMYLNLYEFYFQNHGNTFSELFIKATDSKLASSKFKNKTSKDLKSDYNRFFKGDPIEEKTLSSIKISDMARFLDRAHVKVSKLDIKREQEVIEYHRHSAIRTIINTVYSYANTYEDANTVNPLLSLDYSSWPYYKMDALEKGWYDEEDRKKLLNAFDSIENPNCEDLACGFLLETAARNGECRGTRFEDYHFDSDIPYVSVTGMASDSHRENRVKANSYAGKRNLVMTDRLKKIFDLSKATSWSNEYMFVREPDKVIDEEILITSQGLQRALRRLCERSKIAYLPPHQIRFSEATIMAIEESDAMAIQRRLGHTTPEMSNHYILMSKHLKPAAGPLALS